MVYICMQTRKTPPTHTQRERERDGEKGRGTNKVCVLDPCNIIEDCRRVRERERESKSPGEGEVTFYASKTDINHVSI